MENIIIMGVEKKRVFFGESKFIWEIIGAKRKRIFFGDSKFIWEINCNLSEELEIYKNSYLETLESSKKIIFEEQYEDLFKKRKEDEPTRDNCVTIFINKCLIILKEKYKKEYTNYEYVKKIIENDVKNIKKCTLDTLKNYTFNIGERTKEKENYVGKRKNIDFFIPAGICYINDNIYVNSHLVTEKVKYGSHGLKIEVKNIFYHELGHALDCLINGENIVKEELFKKQVGYDKSSHNTEFKNIVKKNYLKVKNIIKRRSKKEKKYLLFFVAPEIIKEKLDYKRASEESWAESFAFVYNWLINGFTEYDKMALSLERSMHRIQIKIHHENMLYLLKNLDYKKLGITDNQYYKRRIQIIKYMKAVKESNIININNKKIKKVLHRKKYLIFNTMNRN